MKYTLPIEHDALGARHIPEDALYGIHAERVVGHCAGKFDGAKCPHQFRMHGATQNADVFVDVSGILKVVCRLGTPEPSNA